MEMLHGIICIRERIRNSIYSRKGEKTYFICLLKGRFSGKRVFLGGGGAVFLRKQGFERFWGKCLKQIRVSDNASFTDIQP